MGRGDGADEGRHLGAKSSGPLGFPRRTPAMLRSTARVARVRLRGGSSNAGDVAVMV